MDEEDGEEGVMRVEGKINGKSILDYTMVACSGIGFLSLFSI